ncbi:MAG: hypothetical protein KF691_13370 [Phycisphaeraceae bacterium]|nr:hypothetical protein [Phycisphaeraceae bacterium]
MHPRQMRATAYHRYVGTDRQETSSEAESVPQWLCGICGSPAADLKSHIVPKGELRRMKGDSKDFFFLNSDAPSPTRWVEDRFWERGLLCARCEEECGTLDRWWARFSDERSDAVQTVRTRRAWILPGVDVEKLTTFLMSVLVRAHCATIPDFDDFDLGQHFDSAISVLKSGSPLASGFHLIAQIPFSSEISSGLRALPRFSQDSAKACLWFGAFRFVIGFPAAHWSDEERRLGKHRGGLFVSRCLLEETQEYQYFESALRQRRANSRSKS